MAGIDKFNSNRENNPHKQTQGIAKKDFAINEKFLAIFNFFDKDKNGTLETRNANGLNELEGVFAAVNSVTNKSETSIFTSDSRDSIKITNEDLVIFSNTITKVQTLDRTKQGTFDASTTQEMTAEDIQGISLSTIQEEYMKAEKIFTPQKENQGAVKKAWNSGKELLDTDFAQSRIERILKKQELSTYLLNQAKNGELTLKDYYEQKINLIIQMLPQLKEKSICNKVFEGLSKISANVAALKGLSEKYNKSDINEELLKEEATLEVFRYALSMLTPTQLEEVVTSISTMPDDKFNSEAPKAINTMLENALKNLSLQKDESLDLTDSLPETHTVPEGSIAALRESNEHVKLDYNKTFLREFGVKFDEKAILDYTRKKHTQIC